jgi:hypothetical protein
VNNLNRFGYFVNGLNFTKSASVEVQYEELRQQVAVGLECLTVAIRWVDIPHQEILADIYSRIRQNTVERSADDALKHILRRRLGLLHADEHRQFIQLESSDLVELLRCTRDAYRAFTDSHECNPATEAYKVVLRLAVLPMAIASLRDSVVSYASLTRVSAVDLSLLFGISTHACHLPDLHGTPGKWDFDDRSPATEDEIQGLAALVSEDTLLWLEDRGYGHPFGEGPFSANDEDSARHSWGFCALKKGVNFLEWMRIREKLWRARAPWTEGLSTLFGCVQDELLSQCRSLPPDGALRELQRRRQPARLPSVSVLELKNEFVKDGDIWTVTFRGETARFPAKTIGFDYIALILRSGSKPITALQVQQLTGGERFSSQYIDNARRSLEQESDKEDFLETSAGQQQDFSRDAILDDLGRKKLIDRSDELQRQATLALEGEDFATAERLQDEYDLIVRELELSTDIHRRSRVFSNENERARVSVTQALGRAYRKINKEWPELASHLKSEIATGSEFWYRDPSTKWKC